MYFSFLCKVLMASVVFGILLSACSRENEHSNVPYEIQLKHSGECLRGMGDHFRRYFDGRSDRAEVEATWDCAGVSISEFQRLTTGDRAGGAYSREAVVRFLEVHVFHGSIGPALTSSIMEIKRLLVGGEVDSVTQLELSELRAAFEEVKRGFAELEPYVTVLTGARANADEATVIAAGEAVERVGLRLSLRLERVGQPYTFAQLTALLEAVRSTLETGSDIARMLDRVIRLVPALSSAKRILVAGSESVIEGREWRPLFVALTQMGRGVLGARYCLGGDLTLGLLGGIAPDALERAARVLENALVQREPREVPFDEWAELFQRLENSGVMPSSFQPGALHAAFSWAVTRLLGDGAATTVLSLDHVTRLRRHAQVWRDLLSPGPNAESRAQFEAVLRRTRPMTWDSEGRLMHLRAPPPEWTAEARLRMVWPFALVHWLRESYVGTADAMTESDLLNAAAEIVPIFHRFGWLTMIQPAIGQRLLREADLFLFPSNGDERLDLAEATHYVVFAASSYKVARIWLEEADATCGSREASCVRPLVFRPQSRILTPLPDLRSHVLNATPAKFSAYMQSAESIILGNPVKGEIGVGDILQVWMVFQYVEVFLETYDANYSGTIDLTEALASYVKFGPTLSRLLAPIGRPAGDILAFYTFMMKFGETPFTMFGGGVRFLNWKLTRDHWSFSGDRETLMGILDALSKF